MKLKGHPYGIINIIFLHFYQMAVPPELFNKSHRDDILVEKQSILNLKSCKGDIK